MKPYCWQEPLIDAVVASILRDNVFVSGFPTGSGKTVIALAAAKRLDRPHLVVAPKVALTQWRRTADAMGCGDRLVDVVNPEKISSPRGCSWYDRATKWHLPQGTLVTWDEPHRSASGPDSVSARAMAELKAYPGFALHAMSATIADSPMKLRAIGYWTGLHRWNMASYTRFLFDHGCASVVLLCPAHAGAGGGLALQARQGVPAAVSGPAQRAVLWRASGRGIFLRRKNKAQHRPHKSLTARKRPGLTFDAENVNETTCHWLNRASFDRARRKNTSASYRQV